jgi:alpha-tubulin suppressor-like RCC1 family protein
MPISYPYTQYTGIWKLNAASAAKGAGTWPNPPAPKLYSWGVNNSGQLALGNTTYYSSPKQVGSLTNWSSLSAGVSIGFAIKTNGTLWAWGFNRQGQLGLGNTTNYSSPKQVGALTNWYQVSAGGYFVMAIKTDGTLWGWGSNGSGQLGLGNTTQYSSPKQVGSLTNWLKIAANYNWCLAIKTDGTLWAWGSNVYGALGTGNTTYYSSPKQVGSGTSWATISSGSYATAFAIKTDGTIWGWGRGQNGQLGNNTTDYSFSSPIQIGSLTTWATVNSRPYSTLAIKTDGTLWAWGKNEYGQLGIGSITDNSSPVQVGALTNWLFVSGSYSNTTATRKTDGTLWTWGRNDYGQCGQGTSGTNFSSPKQVGTLTSWTAVATGNNHALAIALN